MEHLPRLKIGAMMGGLAAIVYGLLTENINNLALPSVPLFDPPPGALLRFVGIVAAGILLGLIVNWPDDAILGVIYGAVITAFLSSLTAASQSDWNVLIILLLFAYTLLPRAFFMLPVSALIRWASGKWQEPEPERLLESRKRVLLVAAVVGGALLAGYFNLYNADQRFALSRVNTLVRQGVQAGTLAEVPEPLQNVPGWMENARGPYTLQPNDEPDALAAKRPIVTFGTIETLVIVLFENGYRMGCVDSQVYRQPVCWIY